MAVLTTTRLGFPYPDGNDRLRDGDNRIGDLARALDDIDHCGIPYAMAVGAATISSTGGSDNPSVAVTFPSGRFNHTPIVVAQVTSDTLFIPYVATVGSTGATIGVCHVTAGANVPAGSYLVWWHAIQMLPGASPG